MSQNQFTTFCHTIISRSKIIWKRFTHTVQRNGRNSIAQGEFEKSRKSYGRKLRQPFHVSRRLTFSFTSNLLVQQNGGRRANIGLGRNAGENDVQRESRDSTENTSKSFLWDKCCGKINAHTVFMENFPFLKRFTQLLFLAKEQYEAGVTKQLFSMRESLRVLF